MSCLLCLSIDHDGHLVDIVSTECAQNNAASILHTHFGCCFQEVPKEGHVCQKCWIKVSVFHEFYAHIEYVHRTRESIFVENIVVDVKPDPDSDSDRWDQDIENLSAKESIDENPETPGKRKRGRPLKRGRPCKDTRIKLEEIDLESGHTNYNDTFDIHLGNAPASTPSAGNTELKREVIKAPRQRKTKSVKKPKAKKKKKVAPKDYLSDDVEDAVEDDEKSNRTDPTWKADSDEERNESANKLKDHQNQRNESGTFQCTTCDIHFLSFFRLKRHTKETHEVKEFKCTEQKCVDSFETQQLLDDHMTERHTRKECPHCKKMIIKVHYEHHLRVRHDASNNVCCELCGRVSINKQVHNAHYRAVHEVTARLQCDICGNEYKNKHNLRKHITNKHIYGPQTCPICGKVLADRHVYSEHKNIHKPETLNRFRCDVCGHGFRERTKLEEHYHIHTGTAGSHQCKDCGKFFRFASSFSVHKKKMHPK